MEQAEAETQEAAAEITLTRLLTNLWEGHGGVPIRVTLVITKDREVFVEGTTWIKEGFHLVEDESPEADKVQKLRTSASVYRLDNRPGYLG